MFHENYWKKKDYFKHCPCPWLAGYETVRGKYYNYNGKVLDNQVRGNAILKYHIHHAGFCDSAGCVQSFPHSILQNYSGEQP